MKGIVHTVLLLTILPTFAMAEGGSCSGITEQSVCNATPGCGYTNNSCSLCDKGKYNDGPSGECKVCSNGPSGASYTMLGVTTSECPWELKCYAGQYFDEDQRSCKTCSGNTYSSSGGEVTFNGTTTINNTQCNQCPTHSTANAQHTECTCPQHSTLQNQDNTCKCNAGYYMKDNSCKSCPAGSTSPEGSDEQKDCYMDSNTEFCDASGANCVSFGAIFDTPQINYNLD